jgi:LysR family glycine cleavage system transcriptional activator
LVRGGIDLAILHKRVDDAASASAGDTPLLEETVFPVCSPDLLKRRPSLLRRPAELRGERLLQEDHPDSPETEWQTWFALLGLGPVEPARLMRFSSFGTAIGAAVAGSGVALGRSPLVDFELASGRLVRLLPQRRVAGSWRYVMRLRGRPDATLQALCAFLRTAAPGHGAEGSPSITSSHEY